jgi:polysaccharide chain length determinant protein (PEP-CTERM system associated)
MQQTLELIHDHLHGIWRFRWIAMIGAWLVCLLGWAAVMAMPDKYEAQARVFVDTRTALTPVLQGISISQDVNAQLNYVQQSLLGRPQLEKVAREAGLDGEAVTPESRAAMINALRDQVQLTAVGPGRGEPGGTVYTMQYQDTDRARSLKVVQTLLDTFVEDTLGGKATGSEQAQKFLEGQIQDYERQLREAEQRLADFKRRNVGVMPGADGDYFSRMQNEVDLEKKAQAMLSIAITRREEIERQLRGEAPFAGGGITSASGAPANDTMARIKETQAKLDEMLLRFTDKHPDVIALRQTLEELQKRRSVEIEALKRGDPGAAASTGASANPVYQNIQLAMNQAGVEIAALRREIIDRQTKIAELRRMVDTAPEVEADFARLNRGYDITKAQYAALVDKLEKARLGSDAAATGSVRFEVIDPPNAKFQPVAPNRERLIAVVFLAGLAIGGAVAFLLHQLKPVFNNSRVLNEITGLPVLGIVSMTWLNRHQMERRRAYLVYASAAACLLVVFAATARFSSSGSHFVRNALSSAGLS